VELLLVANGATHPFPSVRVVAADCWHPEHQVLALIGRDILDHCFFEYHGPNQQFRLSF
jgi:hypothetical protein